MFSVYSKTEEKPALLSSSGLKSVFEKLRFRDGLVWTVSLNVEIKLRFQIPLPHCARGLCLVWHEEMSYFLPVQNLFRSI